MKRVAAAAVAIGMLGGASPMFRASATDVVSEQDGAAPDLQSFALSAKALDVTTDPTSLTGTAHITDNLAGITASGGDVWLHYRSQSGKKTMYFVFRDGNRISGTTADGVYSSTAGISKDTENGTWSVSGASTKDAAGNAKSYTASEAAALGTPSFTVKSNADGVPPEVTGIRMIPASLDVSAGHAAPTFEVDAKDDASGVSQIAALYASPSGRQYTRMHTNGQILSGTANDGTFPGARYYVNDAPDVRGNSETLLPKGSEPGDWTLRWIQAYDKAGNSRVYSVGTAAYDAIDRGPFTVVSDPADTQAPSLRAFRISPSAIDVTAGPADVTVQFDVGDNAAGVRTAYLQFQSPTNMALSPAFLMRTAASFTRLSDPAFVDGTLTGKVRFPRYDRQGTWSVARVCVVDWVEHKTCYSGTGLTGVGPTSLTVTVNEVPVVKVTGVQNGAEYESGQVPAAGCDVSDKEDGTKSVAPVTTGPDASGNYTTTCSYTDSGGKTGTHSVTYHVEAPTNTAPVVSVTGFADGATVEAGSTMPTPACSVTDQEDTDESAEPVVGDPSGAHGLGDVTVTCSYTDAGGLSDRDTKTYRIVDTTKPELSGGPTTAANAAGWYSTDVTIHWTARDSGSGIDEATRPADEVISVQGRSLTESASVSDLAGNTASATSAPAVNLDKTAPAVDVPSLSVGAVAVGGSSTLTAAVADNLSGVVSGEYFIDDDAGAVAGTPMTLSGGELRAEMPTTLAAGVYTVGVRATDAAGNVSPISTVTFVVYDPEAGFVTGGGSIASEAGAYAADPTHTGAGRFGFVSRYQKGATVPTGNTEFQVPSARFNFSSTSYEWLVVSGGKAQYKGAGTVNGRSGYQFLVTIGDGTAGAADTFRIKVWNAGGVVYDSDLGAADSLHAGDAITGGSIVFHT